MNKYITLMLLALGNFVFSQVGIATDTPNASSDLDLGATDKALYLNRVADPENDIVDPQSGMMLYDTTEHCVKVYGGDPAAWSECLVGASIPGAIASLTCSAVTFSPSNATRTLPYTGQLTVAYTGGNGGAYTAQSFTVNGLTFSLPASNFDVGSGVLIYNITGAPATSGTMTVPLLIGGQSCAGAGSLVVDGGS